MRFNPQTITVTDNKDRPYQIDALVAAQDDGTPVGLAVHPVYDLGPGPMTPRPDEYTLTHVPGGVRLHRSPVPTEGTACRWLELVAPLTDWTQPRETLYAFDTLRLRVWIARAHALTDCEEERDLRRSRPEPCPVSSFPMFRLEALTPLLEWISYGMEYVTLPQQARPALDALLDWHTELARQFNASLSLSAPFPVPPIVL
jgi:hypothetical protein